MTFKLVWFSPPRGPSTQLTKIKVGTISLNRRYLIRDKGAIFCHVRIKMQSLQLEFFITCGNQKCKGGIPAFSTSAISITVLVISIKLEKKITLLERLA